MIRAIRNQEGTKLEPVAFNISWWLKALAEGIAGILTFPISHQSCHLGATS